jgi:hypothetical protein
MSLISVLPLVGVLYRISKADPEPKPKPGASTEATKAAPATAATAAPKRAKK